MIGNVRTWGGKTLARRGVAGGLVVSALGVLAAGVFLGGGTLLDLPAPYPLAVIGLALSAAIAGLLLVRPGAPTERDEVASPVASIDDLVGMLDDTLLIARDESPRGVVEPVDIAALLARLLAVARDGRLTLGGTRSPLFTEADPASIERVFEILIENALASGTAAELWCDRGTAFAVVHVDDDGPGVARADRAHVFDWRYYMSTPPSRRSGCRAELVVAREIVRERGGDITVAASPLGGARFSVRLPLNDAAMSTHHARAKAF